MCFRYFYFILFLFLLVFLVLLRMSFLVFDFFFCGFGCDRGLWLKWRFVGCVGGGLVAVVGVVVGCVGGGLVFFFFFFLAVACGYHIEVVASGVVVEVDVDG